MFIIAAVVYCIGGFFNVLLLDANIQPWAKIDESVKKNLDIEKSTTSSSIHTAKVRFDTESVSSESAPSEKN